MSQTGQLRFRVRYRGRVQGVGFRATCCWIASSHPVTGWVRNEPDGSVTLEAQAEPEALERFLSEVSERMNSKITGTDRIAIAADPLETGFAIAR